MRQVEIFRKYRRIYKAGFSPAWLSKCSRLCFDLPLSMKAVGVSWDHRLSHRDLRTPTVYPQQILPCLLGDLSIICTWDEKKIIISVSCCRLHILVSEEKFTLLQLYVSSFHNTNFTVVNGTRWLWQNKQYVFFFVFLSKQHPWVYMCMWVVCTIVFALHKALPLSEPLHADTQDHWRSLLSLELLVQLQAKHKLRKSPKCSK